MGFRRDFFKNALTLGGLSYTSQAISFVASIVLARLLTPSEYGFVAVITIFTGFISLFTNAGLSYSIIKSNYGESFNTAVSSLSFFIGLSLFVLLAVLSYPIAIFFKDYNLILPIIVVATSFIPKSLMSVPSGVLSKNMDFAFMGLREIKVTIINVFITVVLAFLGFSYWSLILAQAISPWINLIIINRKAKVKLGIIKKVLIILAYRKCKNTLNNLIGFNLINYWARNFDNLIIGRFYSVSDLGIYNRAYTLLTMSLNMLTGMFGSVMLPSLRKLHTAGGDVKKEYLNLLSIISIINFPIGTILILMPDTLVLLLWGNNWIKVAELLPFFGVQIMLQTLLSSSGNMYILLNKENTLMRLGSVGAFILVVSIALGGLFSIKHIVLFYSLVITVIVVPLNLYFGFYKAFHYNKWDLIKFWTFKIIFCLTILGGIWYQEQILVIVVLILMFLELCLNQKETLLKGFKFLQLRFLS